MTISEVINRPLICWSVAGAEAGGAAVAAAVAAPVIGRRAIAKQAVEAIKLNEIACLNSKQCDGRATTPSRERKTNQRRVRRLKFERRRRRPGTTMHCCSRLLLLMMMMLSSSLQQSIYSQ